MQKIRGFLVGLLALQFLVVSAQAQSQVSLGTLTCSGGEGVGMILGSQKTFRCSFSPTTGGRPEGYQATITKVGLDIGVTGKTVIVWTVFATTQKVKPGMLSGTYSGASADVAIGVGGGAKVLIGGSEKSVVLQPLSVQGQTGINLAVGIASMELR